MRKFVFKSAEFYVEVRKLHKLGYSQKQIANHLSVHNSTISLILSNKIKPRAQSTGETFQLPTEEPYQPAGAPSIDPQEDRLVKILGLIKNNKEISATEIAKQLGFSISTAKQGLRVLRQSGLLTMTIRPGLSNQWEIK